MKIWQKVMLVNCAVLIGVVISLFAVPGRTPLWLWATVAIVVMAAMNYVLFVRSRGLHSDATSTSRVTTAVIVAGLLLLVLDVIVNHLSSH